jgi:hypothetical protein
VIVEKNLLAIGGLSDHATRFRCNAQANLLVYSKIRKSQRFINVPVCSMKPNTVRIGLHIGLDASYSNSYEHELYI